MSLVEITKTPTAENAALLLHPRDNVAVARVALAAGQEIRLGGRAVAVRQAVPAGHKVALVTVSEGGPLLRYGQFIGRAARDIAPGEHVHTHNVRYQEIRLDYEFPAGEVAAAEASGHAEFLGYVRPDGRAGTRNYIAVIAASNCAAHTAERIARSFENEPLPENVDGVVAFTHGDGCGHAIGPDTELLGRTLRGVIDHPNVGAALLIGLGCEDNQVASYRVASMTLQESGGTAATVAAARREIARLIEAAASEPRIPVSASRLVLGLNCGGSDSFSGITANPALGVCSDRLIACGGTAVLAETPETFGAEHLLTRRARNRAVGERLLSFINAYREYLGRFGCTFDDNPAPGNKEGGITTILEKSLGAAAKAGSTTLMDVVDYAERIRAPGFVFMNTPGYDPVSLAGLAAGGVNAIAFTTGRGSAIGFPTIPVMKIASNTPMYRRMRDNMDVNAGRVADGAASLEEVGGEIFELLLRVASGEKTAAERLGHKEFVPWRIGPVV